MPGYTKNLFILPFDHRGSFVKKLLGKEGSLTPEDKDYIISQKKIIYQAFKKAIKEKVPKENAAILIDEEFGDEILKDASLNGINIILTVEKSGQKEFTFEYDDFENHIEKYNPSFVKVLIRYNPDDDNLSKKRQQEKLKKLSDYCAGKNNKFLLEVLVIATKEQLLKANGSKKEYINSQRPFLAARAIEELQNSGIEPDVWKLEGTESRTGYEEIVKIATREKRDQVGVIVLGGGQEREEVERWIKIAREVKGIIGFAVGRTIFWQPLLDLKSGKITKEETIHKISENFTYFTNIFRGKEK
ncbi:MAG: DUF2090 domain-containing protein [Candidatus Levyibacteriota bacterium]